MTRRHAIITQVEIARIIRAAKQAGAAEVEVRQGEVSVVIRLDSPAEVAPVIRESVF